MPWSRVECLGCRACLQTPSLSSSPAQFIFPLFAAARVAHGQLWAASALDGFGLVLLTRQCQSVVEYAKGLLEWLSDSAVQAFEDNRTNPFNFK